MIRSRSDAFTEDENDFNGTWAAVPEYTIASSCQTSTVIYGNERPVNTDNADRIEYIKAVRKIANDI